MSTLSTELRNKLERTIVKARDVAEAGATAALEALAVHHHETYAHMSPEERKLRNHLRARVRQLGDKQNRKGELEITHLVWECAYEHWHRMLFARFLAENDLLIEPEMGVAINLEECEELAKEEGKDLWTLASEFAQRMLPQIFRPDHPLLKVTLAREHRVKIEQLLNGLESAVFTASDSLGWVYQFWQSKRKKEVNQSGNKIGADELPAVTQLFTEPYMVSFLLDNSLGAWWAARRLTETDLQNAENEDELRRKASLPGMPLEYLRFAKLDNDAWAPAAGTFDGWPEHLSELKTLDPCCGSGHFMVAAFQMLVPMRMELESLSACDACDAVLRENLHGLEIDERCVELAAFSLALTAWRYPDAGGYRSLLELNVACSGLAISANKEEWLALAGENTNLRIALEELYKQFRHAPVLGSLINPETSLMKDSIFELQWEQVGPLLTEVLSRENNDDMTEMGVVALGLSKALSVLSDKYHFICTNVPYLGAGDHSAKLREHIESNYLLGKTDLATAFLLRALQFCIEGGLSALVIPQHPFSLNPYRRLRRHLWIDRSFSLISRLGPGAFEAISGEVVNVALILIARDRPSSNDGFFGIDVVSQRTAEDKGNGLKMAFPYHLSQRQQLRNPDHRLLIETGTLNTNLLSDYAECFKGLATGDLHRFIRTLLEIGSSNEVWSYLQTSPNGKTHFSSRGSLVEWEGGSGQLYKFVAEKLGSNGVGAWIRGRPAWGKKGISIAQMRGATTALYSGDLFDENTGAMIPKEPGYLPAIYEFCNSHSYYESIRKIDTSLKIPTLTLLKVPFDLNHWTKMAEEIYPEGLPRPYSNDPTQWIFHGHPAKSEHPLQVATARLLDYRWPAELDAEMELSDEQREWVKKCADLLKYVDKDGVVCISSVRGEEPAAERLRELLAATFGQDWSPSAEQELIRATGTNASNLDEWLRDHFFEQHCKLFHHRPFIWHIWDGRRRDGFHALVNYHKLAEGNGKGQQLLESLTYSYLGDWIARQKEGVKRGEGGTEDRLAAALELQKRLIAIIEGEPPFDIFVRWKPIEEQPIGWEPDINDGVRLNIRPFMAQDILGGRKGAGILRWKPNIKWNKDRGKDVASAPWFALFKGDRINDHHLSLEEKRAARAEANRRKGEAENG